MSNGEYNVGRRVSACDGRTVVNRPCHVEVPRREKTTLSILKFASKPTEFTNEILLPNGIYSPADPWSTRRHLASVPSNLISNSSSWLNALRYVPS